eukprot:9050387-Alexandrium_andersonii.AAC.1
MRDQREARLQGAHLGLHLARPLQHPRNAAEIPRLDRLQNWGELLDQLEDGVHVVLGLAGDVPRERQRQLSVSSLLGSEVDASLPRQRLIQRVDQADVANVLFQDLELLVARPGAIHVISARP